MSRVSTRYLVLYVVMMVVVFLLVAGVGAYAGPTHLFSSRYEKGMAEILLSGNNVANPRDYDQGRLQKYYVSGLTEGRDVIVLGDSRSMFLRQDLFPGRTFQNNMMYGAGLHDYFAIYEMYEERGLTPSIVVIELEPSLLDRNGTRLDYDSLEGEYFAMAERLGLSVSHSSISSQISAFRGDIAELLSWPNFVLAASSMIARGGRRDYFATTDRVGILSDGSIASEWTSYPSSLSSRVEATAVEQAKQIAAGLPHGSTAPDQESARELESFVQHLQENGVDVIFYLPPYHPSAYDILVHSEQGSSILQAEAYFRELAHMRGIVVVGSYDPQESSCTGDDFFDAIHPMESGVDKVFSSLDCTPPAKCHVVE